MRIPFVAVVAAPLALGASQVPETALFDPPPPQPVKELRIYDLNQEMVVRDWILCTSRSFAEELLTALDAGREQATAAYLSLQAAKSCGRLPELRVILRESVEVSDSKRAAAGYDALIGVATGWAAGFVIDDRLAVAP